MTSVYNFLTAIFISFLAREAQGFRRGVFRLVWQRGRGRAVNRTTCNYLWVCEPLSLSSDYCVNQPTKAPVINASVSHRLAAGKRKRAGRIFSRANTHDAQIHTNISASAQVGYLCVQAGSPNQDPLSVHSVRIKNYSPVTSCRCFFLPLHRENQRAPSHICDMDTSQRLVQLHHSQAASFVLTLGFLTFQNTLSHSAALSGLL